MVFSRYLGCFARYPGSVFGLLWGRLRRTFRYAEHHTGNVPLGQGTLFCVFFKALSRKLISRGLQHIFEF